MRGGMRETVSGREVGGGQGSGEGLARGVDGWDCVVHRAI